MRLVGRPVLILLVTGVVLHAALLLAVNARAGRADFYAFHSLDCREYYAIAGNVAKHGAFSQSEAEPYAADTWRTPGYPLFLALFVFLFGESPLGLLLVQQSLAILDVLLFFRLARSWMNERRAFVGAVLLLLEPYHLYYSLWLMPTTWFLTVLLLTWLVWQHAIRAQRWGWFVVLGATSGLLVLVRPVGILVPVAVLVGLIAVLVRDGRRRPGRHGLQPDPPSPRTGDGPKKRSRMPAAALPAFVTAFALMLGSWMTRNQLVAGHFALSDQSGAVLAYFKATEVVLWREGRAAERYLETSLDTNGTDRPHPVWEEIDTRLRSRFGSTPDAQRDTLRWRNLAQGNKTTLDSFAVSQALGEIGWSYLTASPLSTAVCCLVRCGSILTFPLNLSLRPPIGLEVDRFTSAIKGSLYALLCIGVVVRLFRGGLTIERAYFPVACTIALLLATTPQIDPRFRVPMIPLLLILALLPARFDTPATDHRRLR